MGEDINTKIERLHQSQKYSVTRPEQRADFCLRSVIDPNTATLKTLGQCVDILEAVEPAYGAGFECRIEGCEVRNRPASAEDKDTYDYKGRKFTALEGTCKFTNYCLKQKWQEISKTETPEAGRALHGEIIETTSQIVGGYGLGANACPNPGCALTAGVSVDGVPGIDSRASCAQEQQSI